MVEIFKKFIFCDLSFRGRISEKERRYIGRMAASSHVETATMDNERVAVCRAPFYPAANL
jgi:hypothetical protein